MNIPKNILKGASTDKTREKIQNVYIDMVEKKIVVTDGRIMATHDIPHDTEGMTSRCITPAMIKESGSGGKYAHALEFDKGSDTVTLIGSKGKVEIPFSKDEHKGYVNFYYLNWKRVMPVEPVKISRVISFNPELLFKLSQAMGSEKQIEIHIQDDELEPYIVKPDSGDAYGIIMPIRKMN